MDKGEKARSEFIVTDGNSAERFELEKEFFHKMAFLIKPPIAIPRISLAIPGGMQKSASWSAINSRNAHLP